MVKTAKTQKLQNLHLGKVDNNLRISVSDAGFSNGDYGCFIKSNGKIFLAKSSEILGTSKVQGGRIRVPKAVAEELDLKEGDYYALIEEDEIEQQIKMRLRLVKVTGIKFDGGDESEP